MKRLMACINDKISYSYLLSIIGLLEKRYNKSISIKVIMNKTYFDKNNNGL